ncbi:hypothetical protein [Streptomyces sp. NPDC049040]|uniref:hypothetical protein n=1 Tax=Streptomyces sp. NPDC049040 TaxID=3365593 RepID=UPI003717C869
MSSLRSGRTVTLRRGALAAVATLAVSTGVAVPAQAAAPAAPAARAQVCPGVDVPSVTGTAPDVRLTDAFADYANSGGAGHWTGADSTYSAPLPGGADAWIFSDSFLGRVNADGSRPPVVQDGGTTPFVNNTFVETRKGRPTVTVTGGTAGAPTALLPPPDAAHWYWARDGLMLGDRLNVVYSEFKTTGSGPLDFGWDRNVLARFDPAHLGGPVSVSPLPSATGISWGAWISRDGGDTYVYGSEDLGAHKYLHVARVAGSDLTRPWQYLTAGGTWSSDESASARVDGGPGAAFEVSNEFSVVKHGRVYVMVTQDLSQPLSAGIDLAFSCSPSGPFVDETTAYTTPESGPTGSYGNANVFTYNPHEHQELGDRKHLVVSYNVNSFVNTDLYADASIYRPRFVDVSLG